MDKNELENDFYSSSSIEIDIKPYFRIHVNIHNVVSAFSTKCHLNLRKIALEGLNVEYRKDTGILYMKIRQPYTTATIWSSGKIVVTGATSAKNANKAARRFARVLQRIGFDVRFCQFRVINILATTQVPFPIRIDQFSSDHKPQASYEPELHPGATYTIKDPKATLKIFSTGSITITAPSVENIQKALEIVCPLLVNYQSSKSTFVAISTPDESADISTNANLLPQLEIIRETTLISPPKSTSLVNTSPPPLQQQPFQVSKEEPADTTTLSSAAMIKTGPDLSGKTIISTNQSLVITNGREASLPPPPFRDITDIEEIVCLQHIIATDNNDDNLNLANSIDPSISCHHTEGLITVADTFKRYTEYEASSSPSQDFTNPLLFLQTINSLEFFNELN